MLGVIMSCDTGRDGRSGSPELGWRRLDTRERYVPPSGAGARSVDPINVPFFRCEILCSGGAVLLVIS